VSSFFSGAVIFFQKIRCSSDNGSSSVPSRLRLRQESFDKHADYVGITEASIRKDVASAAVCLCRALKIGHGELVRSIERLAFGFLRSELHARLKAKQDRVEKMKLDLVARCCGCDQLPPPGSQWSSRSTRCRSGVLCDACERDKQECWSCTPHYDPTTDGTKRRQVAKYETRLPSVTLAKTTIVAACFVIESDRLLFRFRLVEVCAALEGIGKKIGKPTLKKWVRLVRFHAHIPPTTLADRITGYACRLIGKYKWPDPRVQELENLDLSLMATGILRAEARADGKENDKKKTVQEIDGLLQTCLLNARLQSPKPLQVAGKRKPLGGRSERSVAAVLVYLRLRLRGDAEETPMTIQRHRELAGVDLQSFQACKAEVIQLIDPQLWA
jgi:hypothetical protein